MIVYCIACLPPTVMMWYIYVTEYHSAIREDGMPPFETWVDLANIMLSEISQTEAHDFTHMWDVKNRKQQMNKKNNQKIPHRQRQIFLEEECPVVYTEFLFPGAGD